MHHADQAFILSLHRRGLDPGTIYSRCEERIGWRGPLPTLAEIRETIGQPPQSAIVIKRGDRVVAAPSLRAMQPRVDPGRIGTVTMVSSALVAVLWDGRKTLQYLHPRFVIPTGSRAPSPPVAVPVVTPALMATGTADKGQQQ